MMESQEIFRMDVAHQPSETLVTTSEEKQPERSPLPRMSKDRELRASKMSLLTSSSTLEDSFGCVGDCKDDQQKDLSGCGLMITTENGCLSFALTSDANFPQIHPHVYAPSNMMGMKILCGGGSGVAVFGGQHPSLGDLVMKHGNNKDLKELFALATIHQELQRRGQASGRAQAILDMQRRLPEFKTIYISPHHIMEKSLQLWTRLRSIMKRFSSKSSSSSLNGDGDEESGEKKVGNKLSNRHSMGAHNITKPMTNVRGGARTNQRASLPVTWGAAAQQALAQHRRKSLAVGTTIHIYEGRQHEEIAFAFEKESMNQSILKVVLPQGSINPLSSDQTTTFIQGDNTYESLHQIVEELDVIMEERLFKFTLAQKTIGGDSPKTGNQWLYEGKLTGKVLDNLCTQMITVIHYLEELTLPEEVDVVDSIRAEVDRFENRETHERAHKLSKMADTFVGNAIVKNFHPAKGRICILRELAFEFRDRTNDSFFLTDEEALPAFHLGKLLKQGALMSDSFDGMAVFDAMACLPSPHCWRNILRRAVDDRPSMSRRALQRIWNCGLADAGIHNLFVSEDDLYMFDLGEPQLQSIPGFLTKFLFSFFHTLGMEEDGQHGWVNRFRPANLVGEQNQKLALTDETKQLLAHAYDAFETCLDRLVTEVFENDQGIRWLLLRYVTLQLLSDCSFCLEKWQIKGGGSERCETNHNAKGIEKWLWRALWDLYVMYDINTSESWLRLGIVHPHHFQAGGK